MKRHLLFIATFLCITSLSIAQRGGNKILLKSGIINSQNDFMERMNEAVPSADVFEGYYYRLIQFNAIPTTAQRQAIEATGIRLTGYIPYNSFYAAIPAGYNLSQLASFNPRTIVRLQANDKINNQLRYGDYQHARKKGGTVDLIFQYYSNVSSDKIQSELTSRNCEVLSRNDGVHQFIIRVNEAQWNSLAQLPFLQYLQPVAPDPVPDDTKGRSLHRSNSINTQFSTGRHWDGSGVSIALADDGIVGPHIDFTGRLTNISTTPGGFHGDMTTGIAVGAGNLDPVNVGMATGSHIYVFDIGSYPQMVNAASNLANYGTVVISTSYSQGCNDYDAFSHDGDQTMHDLKVVQPVFSAGNSNGLDCGYGAGTQWGNITGGYKQGKNVIACANLDSMEVIDNTSSHGPAADGRIKPDISANGKDQMSTDENNTYQVGGGTSAACPGVAGVCAQLYQAYRTVTGNPNPEAPLIKACVLNSAEDIGNAGPDFKFGYGRINALRAVQTIENNHYLSDSVGQGEVKTHNINVPAGTTNLRVMVLWLDEPGDATAAVALVNDIDMTVTDPSSAVFQPWVLNPTPNAVTLDDPAIRGVDTLNNMEQVTIDNPPAGMYTVTVTGSAIPLGPQKYYVVYEFRNDAPVLTYPMGGEGFVPGLSEVLRWDAEGNTGTFTLEYSTDNGANWNLISNSVASNIRQYVWTVPATSSGLVLVRVTRGAFSDVNDAPVTIIGVPSGLNVSYSCPDTLQLSWNAVTNAIGYEVSRLGAMYMDSIASVAGTSVLLPINSSVDTWFSVRAISTNNGKGRRAIAIHKGPGLINCSLATDAGVDSVISPTTPILYPCSPSLNSVPITVRIRNGGITTLTNFDVAYSLNGGPFVTETYNGSLAQAATVNYTFASTVDFSAMTNFSIVAKVILAGDMNGNNDSLVESGAVIPIRALPFVEDFEASLSLPSGWQSINPNGDSYYWKMATGTGSSGTPTKAVYIDNYNNSVRGTMDYLWTIIFDFTNTPYPQMQFDVAYPRYNDGYDDRLTIEISTDCGSNFIPTGYNKASLALNTFPGPVNTTIGSFTPNAAWQWRRDSVSLTSYGGQSALLRFTDINDFGNNIFIDNINVNDSLSTGVTHAAIPAIGIYPNPSSDIFNISLQNIQGKNISIEVTDMQGRVVAVQRMAAAKHLMTTVDLSNQSKGIYNLRIRTEEKSYYMKLTLM